MDFLFGHDPLGHSFKTFWFEKLFSPKTKRDTGMAIFWPLLLKPAGYPKTDSKVSRLYQARLSFQGF